jgi:hypothetical protein
MKINLRIISALIILLTYHAKAQTHEISIGPDLGLPNGDFGRSTGFGIGGSLRYEAGIGKSIGIGLTAGYISFAGKNTYYSNSRFYIIPVQLFFKYYTVAVQDGFYLMANAGIAAGNDVKEANASFQFGFGPEIGCHFSDIDLGFGYRFFTQSTFTPQYFSLRFAAVFEIK